MVFFRCCSGADGRRHCLLCSEQKEKEHATRRYFLIYITSCAHIKTQCGRIKKTTVTPSTPLYELTVEHPKAHCLAHCFFLFTTDATIFLVFSEHYECSLLKNATDIFCPLLLSYCERDLLKAR